MNVFENFFSSLETIEDGLWQYLGFPLVLLLGIWLTYISKGMQIRQFPLICKRFLGFFGERKKSDTEEAKGLHPLAVFFTAISGCIGIGNIVAITAAIKIGGPGALFWILVTAFVGSTIKYAEVFLGVRYRVADQEGFTGGPMYFLQKAIAPWAGTVFCVLMCLYGVEIYQFNVVANALSVGLGLNKVFVVSSLLVLLFATVLGGMHRVSTVCSTVTPLFIVMYLIMGGYVLCIYIDQIPGVLYTVFNEAWTGSAALGGFAGSSLMMAISQGIRRGCYSSDIGVGYAAIIHSASRVKNPAHQASLTIFGVFLDTFVVCTMSILLILVTGVWNEGYSTMHLVQEALGRHFPHMNFFMPLFLFLLGFSTVLSYFIAGVKTAEYLNKKTGKRIFYLYGAIALFAFAFIEIEEALIVMSLVQVSLLTLNLFGIWRLSKEVTFDCS